MPWPRTASPCPGIDSLQGKVSRIEHAERRVEITPEEGEPYWVTYDHLVVGLGAVARTLPIPGLAEVGVGFKNVEEAIALRNHVLGRIDLAASTWDPDLRRRMLTFMFVGGGFAGIEALAELEDMARDAVANYDTIAPEDLHFVLVEGSPRILPEVSAELGGYTLDQLRTRNIEIHLSTFLTSCVDRHVVLSDGTEFDAETIVWTAGVKANPVLADSDLPLDEQGRVRARPRSRWSTPTGTWSTGRGPPGTAPPCRTWRTPGSFCPPNAQHALRESKVLGANLAAHLGSAPLHEYRHKNVGTVASLGMHKGVAQMFGRFKVRGVLAWFLHRTYHLYAMPTLNRKFRIASGWTATLLFRREVVALGTLHDPRAEFRAAAVPPAEAQGGADAADPEVEATTDQAADEG